MGIVAPEQVEAFRRDGFVVVPDLLSPDELARFGPEVGRGVELRREQGVHLTALTERYRKMFHQCMNLWEDLPVVRELTFHPRIGQAGAELLGVDRLRLWHDQALYKEPGGVETDGHQDLAYWPMVESEALTAWIPLEDATFENGCLGYVPGSHRFGARKFVNIFTDERPYDILGGPEARQVEPVFVEVPAGAVAYHHCLTIHCSKPNATDRMRRVHTAILFRDGNTRGERFNHFAVDRARIEVGAPISSDVTPVVWPRDGLPTPPGDRSERDRPDRV